jgi:hypothetical protein
LDVCTSPAPPIHLSSTVIRSSANSTKHGGDKRGGGGSGWGSNGKAELVCAVSSIILF